MSYDRILSGSVIIYPYLWGRQSEAGETEGRKSRPTAVGIRMAGEKGDLLLLFPITTKAPSEGQWAVEVPQLVKHRAGLDGNLRQWIVLDEANEDVVEKSYYLEPTEPIGRFSKAFFGPLMAEVVRRWREVRRVSRR